MFSTYSASARNSSSANSAFRRSKTSRKKYGYSRPPVNEDRCGSNPVIRSGRGVRFDFRM